MPPPRKEADPSKGLSSFGRRARGDGLADRQGFSGAGCRVEQSRGGIDRAGDGWIKGPLGIVLGKAGELDGEQRVGSQGEHLQQKGAVVVQSGAEVAEMAYPRGGPAALEPLDGAGGGALGETGCRVGAFEREPDAQVEGLRGFRGLGRGANMGNGALAPEVKNRMGVQRHAGFAEGARQGERERKIRAGPIGRGPQGEAPSRKHANPDSGGPAERAKALRIRIAPLEEPQAIGLGDDRGTQPRSQALSEGLDGRMGKLRLEKKMARAQVGQQRAEGDLELPGGVSHGGVAARGPPAPGADGSGRGAFGVGLGEELQERVPLPAGEQGDPQRAGVLGAERIASGGAHEGDYAMEGWLRGKFFAEKSE